MLVMPQIRLYEIAAYCYSVFHFSATKQVMLFDIKKDSDKRLPNGIIEPLYKPPPQTTQKKPDIADQKQDSQERDDEVCYIHFRESLPLKQTTNKIQPC